MEGRTIPNSQWSGFIDDFNHQHEGEPVTVQLLDPNLGPTDVAENVPLLGLSLDGQGTCLLEVAAAGRDGSPYVRHVIGKPRNIRLAIDQEDEDFALEIEPDKGPTLLLLLKGEVQ